MCQISENDIAILLNMIAIAAALQQSIFSPAHTEKDSDSKRYRCLSESSDLF
jgi:hypothetical protein